MPDPSPPVFILLLTVMLFGLLSSTTTLRAAIMTYFVTTRGSMVEVATFRLREGSGRPRAFQSSRYRNPPRVFFALPDAPDRQYDMGLTDELFDRLRKGDRLMILRDPLIPQYVVVLENNDTIGGAVGAFLVTLSLFLIPASALLIIGRQPK